MTTVRSYSAATPAPLSRPPAVCSLQLDPTRCSGRISIMSRVQARSSPRLVLVCVLLLLVFAALEATHAHTDARSPASSCAICVSAHANAPALSVHSLPTLRPLARIAVQLETERQTTALKLT